MKFLKIQVLTAILFAVNGCGDASNENRLSHFANMQEIMARPLLTGASVTSSSTVPSPGMMLAAKFATDQNAVVIARKGAKSVEMIPLISDEVLESRSIVIGVDLMFWDSTRGNIAPSAAAMGSLIDRCATRKIPLIIGDVPNLLGFLQIQRVALNKKIRELCVIEKGCKVLPLDAINQELARQGFITYNSKRYSRRDLLPDGLHSSSLGSAIIATKLEQLIEGENIIEPVMAM